MGKYFGTDGFRGVVNDTLTAEQALAVGRFFGTRVGERGLVIGRDTRRSSSMLEAALAAGAAASGARVHRLGVVSTPAVAYVLKSGCFGGGAMITASHNPYGDNGIKLFGESGDKPSDGELLALEAYLDGGDVPLPRPTGAAIGEIVEAKTLCKGYFDHLHRAVKGDLAGLRVGIDAANGAAADWAQALFAALGAEVHAIHTAPNGCNINLECGSTHPESLRQLVRERGLDVGFAFDGDADRCIAVDGCGEVVNGDGILYVLACHRQKEGTLGGGVVTTVMSDLGLREALEVRGIACELTAVGDRYVRERMEKTGWLLGGEPSGHVIIGDLSETGDGVLTALVLAALIRDSGSLRTLTQGYRPYPRCALDLAVSDKAAVLADVAVLAEIQAVEDLLKGYGRILVRASGTEPVVRVMVEARELAFCEKCAKRVEKIIERGGYLL